MRIPRFFPVVALALVTAACSPSAESPEEAEVISRDTFVEAYYRLRKEGLRSPEMEVTLDGRNRILDEMGLTPEDLLRFAEVRGPDGEFMLSVWQEVDSMLRADRDVRTGDQEEGEEPEEPVRPGVRRSSSPEGGTDAI